MIYIIQVLWKHFYSVASAGEHGTLYQLRNLLNRSNMGNDPTKDFNACEDFLLLVARSLVAATAMTTLGMKTLNDIPPVNSVLGPNPEDIWMKDEEERGKVWMVFAAKWWRNMWILHIQRKLFLTMMVFYVTRSGYWE